METDKLKEQAAGAAAVSVEAAKLAAKDEIADIKQRGIEAQNQAAQDASDFKTQALKEASALKAQAQDACRCAKDKGNDLIDKLKGKTADIFHEGAGKLSGFADKLSK